MATIDCIRLSIRLNAANERATHYVTSEADALDMCRALVPGARMSPDGYGIVSMAGEMVASLQSVRLSV